MSRLGLSSVELLVALGLVAFAAIPLLTMLSTGSREAAHDRWLLAAVTRAESLLHQAQARDFEALAASVDPATAELPIASGLGAEAAPPTAEQQPGFVEKATWTRLADGLALVQVEVRWRIPGDAAGGEHVHLAGLLVSRPDLGVTATYVPRQQPIARD